MDWILAFVSENAAYAHWVVFGSLILAGLNVPISEDIVLLGSGALASSLGGAMVFRLFLFVFLGAYLSDWLAYWIGRSLGPRLWKFGWFCKTVNRSKFKKVERYYERYGMSTLLVGRFIPFGVRNCLFMTAGMARMSFPKFAIADGAACLASNSALFWLAYTFSKHYDKLVSYVGMFEMLVFAAFVVVVGGVIWIRRLRRAKDNC